MNCAYKLIKRLIVACACVCVRIGRKTSIETHAQST